MITKYVNERSKYSQFSVAQSAGTIEYTDCTSAESTGYDTKQSDVEVPVMLELWGMRSTPSLQLLSGPLCPGMVAPDRVKYGLWVE